MIGRSRPPRFRSLEVEPAVIGRGEQVRVRWATRNAESVEIVGVGAQRPSGEVFLSPERSGVLAVSAVGAAGVTTRRTAWIRVIDDVPIATIVVPVPVPNVDLALPDSPVAAPTGLAPVVDDGSHGEGPRLALPPLPTIPPLPALPASQPVISGHELAALVRTVAIDEVDTDRISIDRPEPGPVDR